MLRREFHDLVEIDVLLTALRDRVSQAQFAARQTMTHENGAEWTSAQRERMAEMFDRFDELHDMVYAKEFDAAIANAILRAGDLQRIPEI